MKSRYTPLISIQTIKKQVSFQITTSFYKKLRIGPKKSKKAAKTDCLLTYF